MSDQQSNQFNSPPPTIRKPGHCGGSSSKSNRKAQTNRQFIKIVGILDEQSETVMKKHVLVTIENQNEVLIDEVNQIAEDARKDIELSMGEQRQSPKERQVQHDQQNNNLSKQSQRSYQRQYPYIQQLSHQQLQVEVQKPFQSHHYEIHKSEIIWNSMVVDEQETDKLTDIDETRRQNKKQTKYDSDEDRQQSSRLSQISRQQLRRRQRMQQLYRQEQEAQRNRLRQEIQEEQRQRQRERERQQEEEQMRLKAISHQPKDVLNEYDRIVILGSEKYYQQQQKLNHNKSMEDLQIQKLELDLSYNGYQQQQQRQRQRQVDGFIQISEGQQQKCSKKSCEVDTASIIPTYTIVVKQSPIKQRPEQENGFYKNNDIYGIEDSLSKRQNDILQVEKKEKNNDLNNQRDNNNNILLHHFSNNNGEDFDMSGPSTEELRMMQLHENELKNQSQSDQQQNQVDNFLSNQPQKEQLQVEGMKMNKIETSKIQKNNQQLYQQKQQHQQQQQQRQQSAQNNNSTEQQSTNDFTINDTLRSNVAIRGSEFPYHRINENINTNIYSHPERNQEQLAHNHNLNVVMQHISETQSESKKSKISSQPPLIDQSTKNKTKFINSTESKKVEQEFHQMKFFFNKKGRDIYTVQCFKDPMSQHNKVFKLYNEQEQQLNKQKKQEKDDEDEKSKMTQTPYRRSSSSVFTPSQPSLSKYIMVQINNNHSEQDEVFHREKVQSQLENSMSEVREIYYRNEKDLSMILDYLKIQQALKKGHEEVINMFMKKDVLQVESDALKNEENEEPKIVWREDEPIKKSRMYENQPHSIEDEQLDVSNVESFLSRPHPTVIDIIENKKNIQTEQKQKGQRQSDSKRSKRVTKKKNPNEVINFETYVERELGKKSKKTQVSKDPKGSLYKYELIQKDDKQKLVQVRRSGRIYSKSKAKLEEELKSNDESDQNNQQFNVKGSNRKSLQTSSSKKKQTPHKRSSKKSISKTEEKQKRNEEVTLKWLKEHISELNEIVVENVYMEDQYKAMTQKDAEIANFLDSLERNEIEIKKQQKQQPKKQHLRENQIIKPSKKQHQNRTESKQSKQPKSSKSVRKRKSHMTKKQLSKRSNIKIERTIEMSVKKQQLKHEEQVQFEGVGNNNNQVKLQNEIGVEKNVNELNENSLTRRLTHDEKKRLFNENKKLYRVPDEFPLTIIQIMNPDILNLGIYALVRLGKFSEFQLGTPYAITPICEIKFAKINDVKRALEESKKLVPKEYSDNIALVALNKKMLELIENAKKQKEVVMEIDKKNRNYNNNHSIQQSKDIQI